MPACLWHAGVGEFGEFGEFGELNGPQSPTDVNMPPRPTMCAGALRLSVKAGWLIPFVDKRVGDR